jgi:mono/diheme cytochrome c family protein
MKILKWLGIAVVTLIVGVVVGAGVAYARSSSRLAHKYTVPTETVAIPTDSAALARGAHIVDAIAKCKDCHGANLAGTMFINDPAFGQIAAPNLTRGRGGAAGTYRTEDLVRVIRHGVMPDGRGAVIMPAEAYTYMSDADLGAVIAYVKSVPAVDSQWPLPHLGPVARALIALNQATVFSADSIDHTRTGLTYPAEDTSVAYGRYLANIGGCSGCHNHSFSGGGRGGPPGSPPPWNLTPTGLAGWTEANFVTVLREGKAPDGRAINNAFMPWRSSGHMTDAEIHAVWKFLQTVPAKEMGQR